MGVSVVSKHRSIDIKPNQCPSRFCSSGGCGQFLHGITTAKMANLLLAGLHFMLSFTCHHLNSSVLVIGKLFSQYKYWQLLRFWRCMAWTLTTSSCWDWPIDSYDIVTTCLIMSERGLSSQQSTWKCNGPHSQNIACSTQAIYHAQFIHSLHLNSILVEQLVHRANSLLRMINASYISSISSLKGLGPKLWLFAISCICTCMFDSFSSWVETTTVEPPNKGHFRSRAFVLFSEVVLWWEVRANIQFIAPSRPNIPR